MALARRSRPFVRSTRRATDWGFGVDMLNQTMSVSSKILGTTSLTVGAQVTIVRIRGLLHLTLDSGDAAGAGFAGAAGIALVNSDAFAAGAGSIPGPVGDANWDRWMWHSFFDVRSITGAASGANAVSQDQRIIIDSKSMRKWDPAETLVLMVEGVEATNAVLRINCDSRILAKDA